MFFRCPSVCLSKYLTGHLLLNYWMDLLQNFRNYFLGSCSFVVRLSKYFSRHFLLNYRQGHNNVSTASDPPPPITYLWWSDIQMFFCSKGIQKLVGWYVDFFFYFEGEKGSFQCFFKIGPPQIGDWGGGSLAVDTLLCPYL